jgi:hypothetical protein
LTSGLPWAKAVPPSVIRRRRMPRFFIEMLISVGYGGTKIDFLVSGAKAVLG